MIITGRTQKKLKRKKKENSKGLCRLILKKGWKKMLKMIKVKYVIIN